MSQENGLYQEISELTERSVSPPQLQLSYKMVKTFKNCDNSAYKSAYQTRAESEILRCSLYSPCEQVNISYTALLDRKSVV